MANNADRVKITTQQARKRPDPSPATLARRKREEEALERRLSVRRPLAPGEFESIAKIFGMEVMDGS